MIKMYRVELAAGMPLVVVEAQNEIDALDRVTTIQELLNRASGHMRENWTIQEHHGPIRTDFFGDGYFRRVEKQNESELEESDVR